MKTRNTNSTLLFMISVGLTVSIFTSDILTPLGIAWGFVYIIVVLITLWIPGKTNTMFFALAGILLTGFCFFTKPAPEIAPYIVVTNRTLSVIGILVTMFGILKYKGKERQVQEQKDKLEKLTLELKNSNSELEQFAYVASHDLQEPLRKIQSFGDRILSSEKEKLSENGKDYFARIMNAAERMQTLINDLLSFSRLNTKAEAFGKIDLNIVVREVLNDLEVLIEKTHSKIDLENLPTVRGDATQIRQLFQNLISNAIKFRKEEVPAQIKIYCLKIRENTPNQKEFVEIYFEDNGIGFDEKYSEKIFNIFQRLEGKKYEGSGIGLAVCKKIVARHGGTISVKSTLGEGTAFIVTLPLTSTS